MRSGLGWRCRSCRMFRSRLFLPRRLGGIVRGIVRSAALDLTYRIRRSLRVWDSDLVRDLDWALVMAWWRGEWSSDGAALGSARSVICWMVIK